jgi:hypothetical protein
MARLLLVIWRKAQFPVGQADQALGLQLGVHLLAEGAVDHRVGFLAAGEHEGEVVHLEILHLAGQDAGVHRGHLDRAALQGRHHRRVAAQHAAGEQVDLDLAAGLGLHDLGELLHAHHQRMALGVLGGELDGFLLRKGHAEGGNRDGGGEGLEHQTFHGLSPEGKGKGKGGCTLLTEG